MGEKQSCLSKLSTPYVSKSTLLNPPILTSVNISKKGVGMAKLPKSPQTCVFIAFSQSYDNKSSHLCAPVNFAT